MKMYKSDTTSNSQITTQPRLQSHHSMKGIHQYNFQAILKPLQTKWGHMLSATSNQLSFSSNWGGESLFVPEFLQLLARSFKTHKFSSENQGTYTIHCGFRMDDHSFNIFSNKIIPHLKAISKLELIFDHAQNITSKGLFIFGKQIRIHLKNLKHLKITLKCNSQITNHTVELFGLLISKRLTKLEVFSLSFHQFSQVSPQCSRPFSLELEKHLRKLKSSSFQFFGPNFSPRLFHDPFPIAPRCRYDKNLTDFQFWAPGSYSEELISDLLSYLFKNPQIMLRFHACQPEQNGGNVKLIKIFSKDKKKEGSFVLDGFGLANQWGPEAFMRALKNHSGYRSAKVQRVSIEKTEENQATIQVDYSKAYDNKAQRLCLHFKGFNSLSKKFFEALNDMVTMKMKVNDLKELKINLKGFREIGGEDFNTFGKSTIPALSSLEKLSLGLEKCGVTGTRFQTLMNSIGTSLKKLESLDLNFRDLLVFFSDKDLANFTNSLQGISQLKNLRLNLGNLKITDQGIEFLAKNIGQNMTSLDHLCIICDKCPVTDKSLTALKILIEQLKTNNLRELSLSFEGCSNLTENSIREFHQSLTNNDQEIILSGGWFEESRKMLIENEAKGEKSLFEIQSGTFTNDQMTKILDNLIKNEIDLEKSEKLPFFCVTSEEVKAHLQKTKELNYSCQSFEKKDVYLFAKNVLANLKNIEKLSLNFEKSQVTEELMEILLSEIGSNHPKTLKSFNLTLADCEGVPQSFRDAWRQRLQAKSISQVNIN